MNKLVIELGGKERTLKFNMLMQEKFETLMISRFSDDDKAAMMKNESTVAKTGLNVAFLVFAAMESHYEINGITKDFSLDDCIDWVDEIYINDDSEKMDIISAAYFESNAYKAMVSAKKKMELIQQQIGMQSDAMPLEKSESGQQNTTT